MPAAPEGRHHWYEDKPKYALLVTNSVTETRTTHTVNASGVAKVELHAFSSCHLQVPEKEWIREQWSTERKSWNSEIADLRPFN